MDVCVADLTLFGVPGGAKLLWCEVMLGPCSLYFGLTLVKLDLVSVVQLLSGYLVVITIFGVPGVTGVPWGCGVILGPFLLYIGSTPVWLVILRHVQLLLCFIVVSVA